MRNIKKILLISVLGIANMFLRAQEMENSKTENTWHLISGFETSLIKKMDSTSLNVAYLPHIGFSFNKYLFEKSRLKMALFYTMRGSESSEPFLKYRYNYVDLLLLPQYRIGGNTTLGLGLQSSFLAGAKIMKGSGTLVKKISGSLVNPEFYLVSGISFGIQKNFNMGIDYHAALGKALFHGIRFSLDFTLTKKMFQSKQKRAFEEAYDQIIQMKNANLLYRLQSSFKSMEAMQKKGNIEEAERIKKEQDSVNLEIISAFRNHFDFCPVYFFYNYNTKRVKNLVLDSIFVNDTLETDSTINLNNSDFYIAAIENTDGRSKMASPVFTYILEDNKYIPYEDAGISVGPGFEALLIMDKHFGLMQAPFPAYIKRNEFLNSRKTEEMIDILNARLHRFYKEAMHFKDM
jgi:hypothetical protein